MKVYFSANHRDIKNDLPLYRRITETVQSHGHIIVNNWIEATNAKSISSSSEWSEICSEARAGIEDAEVVIAEASGPVSFGAGFEAGFALAKGKKLIILLQEDKVSNSYASGLDRSEVAVNIYRLNEVEAQLSNILRRVV